MIESLQEKTLDLLKNLIQTQSFSEEEAETALHIQKWLQEFGIKTERLYNNIWAKNKHFDESKPTILLNSHHDTVRPNKGYTRNPFEATIEDGKLFGLGSNDAGASLVALLATFVHYYEQENLKYNLIVAATGEEENSGQNGLCELIKYLPIIDFAIIGEPTQMQLAIAEKGLLVIDGYAKGIAGHAAHNNTKNAIYEVLQDIEWIKSYQFPKESEFLGKVKMSVTQINAGSQHNVVPASCHFVVDVRINEMYQNTEVFEIIDKNTNSELKARSFRLNSSSIPKEHPFVQAGIKDGHTVYGSPTLSDQAVLSCPSVKLGIGDSLRSHQADEFIYLHELENGLKDYIKLLGNILT
ncbi:M20 family metallo-hydrolase [Bernardetia sp.]|uniref:M20 family metallo-hydrolase n=1 Tax=Bernardetia sp. TaxID=1937974 RepID=UPI0025BBB247|nr:M20 family metallo-hydrolase [Bernardetia sp.]